MNQDAVSVTVAAVCEAVVCARTNPRGACVGVGVCTDEKDPELGRALRFGWCMGDAFGRPALRGRMAVYDL